MKRNNYQWQSENLLILPEADTGSLFAIPDVNPYAGIEGSKIEMRETIDGFTSYNEDTWLSYRNEDTAIVTVSGMIVPEGQPWHTMFGVTPLNVLEAEYALLEADESVKTIITKYNSPGGIARSLSGHHKFLSGLTTKTIGFTDGISASASYFAMSANDEIVAEELGSVGSIGTIVQLHKPDPEVTTIVSEQSPYKDKSDPRNHHLVQAMANDLTKIFHKYVASGRNTTVEDVAENFGKGDVFLAEKAMERGMIDKVMTFKELIASEVTLSNKDNTPFGALMNTSEEVQTMEESTMKTVDEFKAESPDLFAEVEKSVKADMSEAIEASGADALQAETARISGIMALTGELGELNAVQSKAAMSARDEAILDPSVTVEAAKGSMAMAALTAIEKSDSVVANHGEQVAQQAEEQGNVTPEAKAVTDDGKSGGGLASAYQQLEDMGVDFSQRSN